MKQPEERGYYRHPTIHGDDVAFVCEDDLWLVSLAGGTARRLTANPGSVTFPSYSPDGRWIAYTSTDDGPAEAYVIPAFGGAPRRLTWLGSLTHVAGWHPDGDDVVLASNWRQPFQKSTHLHRTAIAGGPVRPMNLGPARAISFQSGGPGVVIGRNSGDPARWKRYRGGTAGTIWIDRKGAGKFTPLVRVPGNLASPMWIGRRVYFLSDHEGFGNLYSCAATGRDVRRHTDHEDYYVRFPATDGQKIVYGAGADLHCFDPEAETVVPIPVSIRSARPQRSRRFVDARRSLESFDLHPEGHSIASVNRGGVFTYGLWEGAATRHGEVSNVRYRLATWLPDGKRLVAVADHDGEEVLVVFSTEGAGQAQRIADDFGRALEITVAPRGNRVAISNERQQVIVVELDEVPGKAGKPKGKRARGAGRPKVIERSEYSRIDGMAWSPDGRWLAYAVPVSHRATSIKLYDAGSGRVTEVTRPEFRDSQPAWDPEGKYLYFIGWRIFDPVYDTHYFDLGFPRGAKPFLIPLTRDLCSPFSSATRAPRAPTAEDPDEPSVAGGAKPDATSEPVKVEIDFDGIADRAQAFPVPEGIYGRIAGLRGQAVYSVFPVRGSLGVTWQSSGEPDAHGGVEVYDFDKGRAELLSDEITDFEVAMSAPVLALRAGNRVRVAHASFRIDRRPEGDEPGRESGWVDFERLRVAAHPADEWRQMFLEAWRLQRDHFWTSDMSGVDWDNVRDRYLPLVDRCSCRAEFSDLLWEMQGELGTSHCYELGGDYREQPDWFQGFLGADLELDPKSGTWRVTRIPHGDSWNEKEASPLAAPGIALVPGDEILEVDGLGVDAKVSPDERLVNLAGREVQLTVRSVPLAAGARAKRVARVVTVRTLREEFPLRYRDWVETNLERVHRESGGRVGYVHVPNMGPVGYAEFHRYYMREVDRDGLVIDVRFNGGGHVSQLLLEKLLRRRVGYDQSRWGRPDSYPSDAPMGPMVALTNEYAGSDGDIFSHCFKLYELGPLIGKRTWGGVIGIWPRHSLVDGTVTTQAEFAHWFEDVGWGVENYGVDPDIEVDIKPQDHAAGKDPQLERALREIKKRLGKSKRPVFEERPDLAPGPLPRASGKARKPAPATRRHSRR